MAKKNNINITSKNTYISSKALKRATTPSGDNKKEKEDNEIKKAIRGGVESISGSIKKTNDYLALITGAVLGCPGITPDTDFETLKSRITNSESLTNIINNRFSNLTNSLKEDISNLNKVISQLKPLKPSNTPNNDDTKLSFEEQALICLKGIDSKLLEISNKSNNNVNGSVDIVIKGINKEGIDSLANLLKTKINKDGISNNDNYNNIVNGINNISNLIDVLYKLSGKTSKLDEVMSNVLKIKDDTILDAAVLLEKFSILGSVDFSGITNKSIGEYDKLNALINTLISLDTGAIEEAVANIVELSFVN